MTITINGTTGVAGVDGTAATPALQGNDTDTGVYFGTNEVYISTGGTLRATVGNSGLTLTTPLVFPAGAVGAPSITTTGDINTGIYFPAADTIGFVEGGVESMRLDSSGNLGLGVTPSAWNTGQRALQFGSLGSLRTDASTSGNGTVGLNNNVYFSQSGSWLYVNTAYASRYEQYAGAHQWFTAPSGAAGSAISFTQAMTLDSNGRLNLGAQSTAPNDASGFWLLNQSGVGPTLAGLNITFQTGSTGSQSERARIDSSGRLLVGTTSTIGYSERLGVAGTIATSGTQFNMAPGADFEFVQRSAYKMTFYVNSASVMASLSITGVWTNASDARTKSNIREIEYGLADVLKTKPRSFLKNGSDKPQIGFVAQELEEAIPDVVFGGDDEQYTVDYGSLTAVAFKAIQELAAKVSALEAKQ